MERKSIGCGTVIFLTALPAAVEAAPPQRTSAGEVAAAANRCGLRGLIVHRGGPRRFLVEQVMEETTVTVEEGPLSPERERQLQAEADAAMRPWHCLMRWTAAARQHRVGAAADHRVLRGCASPQEYWFWSAGSTTIASC